MNLRSARSLARRLRIRSRILVEFSADAGLVGVCGVCTAQQAMNRLKAKFGRKAEESALTAATKGFIKGEGDDGLNCLPTVLEACSSASAASLASQIEVLGLITKYYDQAAHAGRQMRCVDLLRYLSDQRDNELFNLLSQGHPLLKLIDTNLRTTSRSGPTVQKSTRVLLDHLVRQANVPDTIVELHAKHVNGIGKPHRPTIILSDQEVVADDIRAAEAESELLSTLLTDANPDDALLLEVHGRISNTRERLVRDIDTSTNEQQTRNLIAAIETIERVLTLYKEMNQVRGTSADDYEPPTRSARVSADSSRASVKHNGKGRAADPESPVVAGALVGDSMLLDHGRNGNDHGEGSSTDQERFRRETGGVNDSEDDGSIYDNPATASPFTSPPQVDGTRQLSSNNPFAKRVVAAPEPTYSSAPTDPFADQIAPTTHAHSEGELDDQWRSLKI